MQKGLSAGRVQSVAVKLIVDREEEIEKFICMIPDILQDNGILYFSLKSGITTGMDTDGRFFTDVSEEKVQHLLGKSTAIKIVDMWKTEDKLNRNGFFWINVIAQKP